MTDTLPSPVDDDISNEAMMAAVEPLARKLSKLCDGTDMRIIITAIASLTSALCAQAAGGDETQARRLLKEHHDGLCGMIGIDCESIRETGEPVL
jgi:hypothetical protein